ncbi:retinol dehydrogenase [Plectosphaerella plurivora]|uniref:Retinol dehydrogenase n=1 Tax=Plectosphaerella plurivora TaxID=936078 RepID=A0A9P8VL40_9PEZI|nr:retinol dehydrogenase [Plectosphaerella plurivora]
MAEWLPSLFNHFRAYPYPEGDFSGKTVIVTGANVGLGLEASRHFARLEAQRIILTCRDTTKGEAARKDIQSSLATAGTSSSSAVLEVWQLDLADVSSIRSFAKRVDSELERVDYFMSNAGLGFGPYRQTAEGWEEQLGVNVIGTFLLALLVLPAMRRTTEKYGVKARLCVTASTASHLARFSERKEPHVLQAINSNTDLSDRYKLTKLLQIMIVRQLAMAMRLSSKNDNIIVTSIHPGLCSTDLFRSFALPLKIPHQVILKIIARTPEMGSRTLLAAALSKDEAEADQKTATHGRFLDECAVGRFPDLMLGQDGEALQVEIWKELLEALEGIEPGVGTNL